MNQSINQAPQFRVILLNYYRYVVKRYIMLYNTECDSHTYCRGLSVELSLLVLTNQVCRGYDSNTQPSTCGAKALAHCTTTAAVLIDSRIFSKREIYIQRQLTSQQKMNQFVSPTARQLIQAYLLFSMSTAVLIGAMLVQLMELL